MKKWEWYVYVVECKDGLYYTGMTFNLTSRMDQHRSGKGCKFTAKHGFKKLVYAEKFEDIFEARLRERQIKDYRREKKEALWKWASSHSRCYFEQ